MINRRTFLQRFQQIGWIGAGAGLLATDSALAAGPTSRPAAGIQGLGTLLQTRPADVRLRIAVMADTHFALRDKSLDFKVLRFAPWILRQHFLMMQSLGRLTGRKVDQLLVAGDLTKHSEPWNHRAMQVMLRQQPFPSLVVPGNHDVFKTEMGAGHWGLQQFVAGYQGRYGGYQGKQPYYAQEIAPGIVVIGLNSSDTPDGSLRGTWNGKFDPVQLQWLEKTLKGIAGKKLVLLMVHHNLLPHHPADQEDSKSVWKNFHADNADEVLALMHRYRVPVAITGHHHINHIVKHKTLPITEITTAGACSYPSNFRILDLSQDGRRLTVHTIGLPWPQINKQIADAARRDPFWKLPDKPKDAEAFLRFAEGSPQDRHTVISL